MVVEKKGYTLGTRGRPSAGYVGVGGGKGLTPEETRWPLHSACNSVGAGGAPFPAGEEGAGQSGSRTCLAGDTLCKLGGGGLSPSSSSSTTAAAAAAAACPLCASLIDRRGPAPSRPFLLRRCSPRWESRCFPAAPRLFSAVRLYAVISPLSLRGRGVGARSAEAAVPPSLPGALLPSNFGRCLSLSQSLCRFFDCSPRLGSASSERGLDARKSPAGPSRNFAACAPGERPEGAFK